MHRPERLDHLDLDGGDVRVDEAGVKLDLDDVERVDGFGVAADRVDGVTDGGVARR